MRREQTSRETRCRSRAVAKWVIWGFVAWIAVAATIQKGPRGALEIGAALFVIASLFALRFHLKGWLSRYAALILVPVSFALWLWFSGSYSLRRDIAVFVITTALCFYFLSSWWRAGSPRELRSQFLLAWFVLSWAAISIADRIGEASTLQRRGLVADSTKRLKDWQAVRVGLALSGGGYRAALVHSGVIFELSRLGVPISHMSAVSGGSIVGSFVAAGGAPEDFVEAVADGRFRLKRDLTWIWNVLRLTASMEIPLIGVQLFPAGAASRLDIQAELLDRVLLGGVELATTSELPGPELIVNATDLRHGLSVGFTKDSVLIAGLVANNYASQPHVPGVDSGLLPVFFHNNHSLRSRPLPRLSRRVAVSGAFPGAFEATDVSFSLSRQHNGFGREPFKLDLSLVDGGIRDNLGVNALKLADRLARVQADPSTDKVQSWVNDRVDPAWQLDVMIASNGGQAFRPAGSLTNFQSLLRAIELNGLETGALRPMWSEDVPQLVMLSDNATLAFTPDLILAGRSPNELVNSPETFMGSNWVDDESLAAMARMASSKGAVDKLIAGLQGRDEQDKSACTDRSNASAACARAKLVELVGQDLWKTYTVFREASTLKDVFERDEAHAIFRYGRYLVRLRAKLIREALDNAKQSPVALRAQ